MPSLRLEAQFGVPFGFRGRERDSGTGKRGGATPMNRSRWSGRRASRTGGRSGPRRGRWLGFGGGVYMGSRAAGLGLGWPGLRPSALRSSTQVAQGQASRNQAKLHALLCPSAQSISSPLPSVNSTRTFSGVTAMRGSGRFFGFARLLVLRREADALVAHNNHFTAAWLLAAQGPPPKRGVSALRFLQSILARVVCATS